MRLGKRGPQHVHRDRAHDRDRAAGMIGVVVRDDQRVETREALAAQERDDDAAARVGVGAVRRARVVEHDVVLRPHQRGEPLSDVEERDPGRPGVGHRRPQREHRQAQERRRVARRHAARREQPRDAGERERRRPGRGRMALPGGARQPAEPVEHRHQREQDRVRELGEPSARDHRCEERERRDDEAHDRDRDRVRDRRDDRHLLEQHEQQRREPDRDRPLHAPPGERPVLVAQGSRRPRRASARPRRTRARTRATRPPTGRRAAPPPARGRERARTTAADRARAQPRRRRSCTACAAPVPRNPRAACRRARRRTPLHAAAFCAGSASPRRGRRRHSQSAIAAARPATIVTCKPEIDIRWPTPVRVNVSQSSVSIARWSPIASAISTPA